MTNSGLLSVAVRLSPDTKKPAMLLLLPLGIYLPAGVTVQFGQEAVKTIPLQNCDGAGCLAEYAVTEPSLPPCPKGKPLPFRCLTRTSRPFRCRCRAPASPRLTEKSSSGIRSSRIPRHFLRSGPRGFASLLVGRFNIAAGPDGIRSAMHVGLKSSTGKLGAAAVSRSYAHCAQRGEPDPARPSEIRRGAT